MGLTVQVKAELEELAGTCIRLGDGERPEMIWLKERYERFRSVEGIFKKNEADELIYAKMYASLPQKPSDTLKIRYWRTGRHMPLNRSQCVAFGRALDLSEEEQKELLISYGDRCDRAFGTEPEQETPEGRIYDQRRGRLEELTAEYLDKIHPIRRVRMGVHRQDMKHYLRHFYYTDARAYLVRKDHKISEKHLASINYDSEFNRQMLLLGEIPRKTMIRHIFIFAQPFLNRSVVSGYLEEFGYLPLTEKHTTARGSHLDRMILGFLKLYEESCHGMDPAECSAWLQEAYQYLDSYLGEKEDLRFLYFKALKG